jgi:putative endonuclease
LAAEYASFSASQTAAPRSIVAAPRAARPARGICIEPLHIDRRQLGQQAECRAVERLRQAGFIVLARNFRCRAGELDIVARRGGLLVIAEVRLRRDLRFGGAPASITAAKRARIVRATRYLLRCQPALARLAVRFDALLLSAPDGPIEWIEAAFEAT